jgi:GNAT superfamily N-acetyltransferase
MITRRADADDVPQILMLFRELDHLHAEALPAYFQVPQPSQLTPEEVIHASNDPKQYLQIALDDDKVVGVVFAQLEEEADVATSIFRPRRLCWIRKLVVTHSYRGQGVGRHLMQQLEQWAKGHGVFDIELLVWAFNRPAFDFYTELGYAPCNHVFGKTLSREN